MQSFYKNKRVLITGSTGFVGSWLCLALNRLNAEVYGIGLKPNTNPNIFNILELDKKIKQKIININNYSEIKLEIESISPDIVFHLAAQPIVKEGYRNPLETFNTNIMGSLNILDICSNLNKSVNLISITTDKCYENEELGNRFLESDSMGGKDPYSASKACTEITSKSFALSFSESRDIKICTARAGNIIGGGDWSNDRIVTDIIESIRNKQNVLLRSPSSVRPWQHVIDVIDGYLKLGVYNSTSSLAFDSFNFGPKEENEIDVKSLTSKLLSSWGKSNTNIEIDNSDHPLESEILRLNSSKAKEILLWEPSMNIDEAILNTAIWYKKFYDNENMYDFSMQQLSEYI